MGCCKGQMDIASKACEQQGGVEGGRVNNVMESPPSASYTYANCCGRKARRAPAPGTF